MNNEIMEGIIQKMHSLDGKTDILDLLDTNERCYLEQIRENAFRTIEENFKIVRNATDILEQKRNLNPRIITEPIDASWLANLPDTQRAKILEIKKRQEEIFNQSNI